METTPGTRLRHLRELLGYKGQQQDFADKVGLTQQSISNMERDKTEPANKSLNKILLAFPQVNISWLVSGQGQPLGESRAAAPAPTPLPTLTLAEEPAAAYGCVAPDMVATLNQQLGEAHVRIVELEAELRDERKQARIDLRSQAALYNSVKVDQQVLIDRLYAKLDEYELLLGYRKPTAAERQAQEKEQAGSGAPRVKMISFGERYRTPAAEPVACVMREMYPATAAALGEAA